MTVTEKRNIATVARSLIRLLQECDDEEFVDTVISCVTDGELLPLLPGCPLLEVSE